MIIGILVATGAWFLTAGLLFFNPPVDKLYNSQVALPGVRSLPKAPQTIGMILGAIIVQVVLWAWVFTLIKPVLPTELPMRGVLFGLVLTVTKMIPRDIDRLLLSTYPKQRMIIEAIIGIICAFVVGLAFAYTL
jgi:hypothetical protein